MIIIKEGDILNATEDIICQQVNCKGVMGSGLAYQIRKKYPEVYEIYRNICENCSSVGSSSLLGHVQFTKGRDGKYIANLFSQDSFGTKGRYTDYDALEQCLMLIFLSIKKDTIYIENYEGLTIAIPYGIGCGLGGGDWEIVYKIIEKLSEKYECDVSIYKYDMERID